jgi:hypothetical protein
MSATMMCVLFAVVVPTRQFRRWLSNRRRRRDHEICLLVPNNNHHADWNTPLFDTMATTATMCSKLCGRNTRLSYNNNKE